MLAGLALLLANDFVFKALFHNALTGKLSDFAGLFVFPLFWSALAPRRRREIYALTALGFVFWKSSYSQTLIDVWNSLRVFNAGRVVDATDLLALVALVPSYLYGSKSARGARGETPARPLKNWARAGAAAVALFAFTATSFFTNYDYENQRFIFADSKVSLLERLERVTRDPSQQVYWSRDPKNVEFSLPVKTDCCCNMVSAHFNLYALDEYRTELALRQMSHRCSSKEEGEREKMLSAFLHEVVEKLQDDIEARPPDREAVEPPRGAARRR